MMRQRVPLLLASLLCAQALTFSLAWANPVADCGASWATQGTFSCDADNAEHQQICGCLPPRYNEPLYWNDLGSTCYSHYTGRQCSANSNPPATPINPGPNTSTRSATVPPVTNVSPASAVTLALADCGANWATLPTFSCDAAGLEHQQICSCRPPLYNNPAAWIHTENGCYTHFTGNSCAPANTQLNSTQFVTRLHLNLLGRSPTADDLDYWTHFLDSNQKTREEVRSAFLSSADYNVPAFVNKMYNDTLGHPPAAPAALFWISSINSGLKTRLEVEADFRQSPEYLNYINHQDTACTLVIPDCPNAPDRAGITSDAYNSSNVNAARCQQRARDYSHYCHTGQPVIAMFQNHGQTTIYSMSGADASTNVDLSQIPVTERPDSYWSAQVPESYWSMQAALIELIPQGSSDLMTYTTNGSIQADAAERASGLIRQLIQNQLVVKQGGRGLEATEIGKINSEIIRHMEAAFPETPVRGGIFGSFLNIVGSLLDQIVEAVMRGFGMGPQRMVRLPGSNMAVPGEGLTFMMGPVNAADIAAGQVEIEWPFSPTRPAGPGASSPRVISGTALVGPLSIITMIAPFLVDLTIESLRAFQHSPLYNLLLTPDQQRALDSYIERLNNDLLLQDPNYTQHDDSYWYAVADSGLIANDGSDPEATTSDSVAPGGPSTNSPTIPFNPGSGGTWQNVLFIEYEQGAYLNRLAVQQEAQRELDRLSAQTPRGESNNSTGGSVSFNGGSVSGDSVSSTGGSGTGGWLGGGFVGTGGGSGFGFGGGFSGGGSWNYPK